MTFHTWQRVLQLADAATELGRTDWRLPNIWHPPNIKALTSLVELACDAPASDLAMFLETPGSYCLVGVAERRQRQPRVARPPQQWR
ncbi:MAG: DUF1566 domain-containing protein [Chromatiaceae bacterium]|nr:MAG: DUF1566 domain-containing protein [Chromatiaceae bacterium]